MFAHPRTFAVLLTIALASSGTVLGIHMILAGSASSGSDYGLDTNGNGKYEWLVVNADVNLPSAGTWMINAVLSSSTAPVSGSCGPRIMPLPMMGAAEASPLPASTTWPIAWAYESYFFESGAQIVRVAFNGTEIDRAGVNGPYTVELTMSLGGSPIVYGGIASSEPGSMAVRPTDEGITWTYVTKAYAFTDFDVPVRPAYFTGGHSDLGVDVDSDGLYDFLEIRADVHVNVAGTYYLNGVLYKSQGNVDMPSLSLGYAYRDVSLSPGDTSVDLRFRGDTIRAAGVDGPYDFSLTLYGPSLPPYMGNGTVLPYPSDPVALTPVPPEPSLMPLYYYPETLCGSTGGYPASSFNAQSELVTYTGVFDEVPQDWDQDGLYDLLTIRAQVDVHVSAVFDLQGVLRSADGTVLVASVNPSMWLPQGVGWADFTFLGPDIRASGIDGPYRATLSLTPGARGLDPTITYSTAAYRATQFDADGYKCYNCTVPLP
ncbi:MAG: hypothetical protein WC985_04350 [Thermoplasmata archaeon]